MTYTPISHVAVDRPEVSRSAFGYIVVDNLTDLDSRVTTNASGKADKTTTVSAGTGLTGGGDLSANRTLTVAYGTTAGTATQGNDTRVANAVQTSRLVSAGTGLTGGGDLSADRTLTVAYGNTSTTAASGDRVTTLETISNTAGRRWHASTTAVIAQAAGTVAANTPVVHPFDTVETTEVGYTYSAGVFTVTNAGVYDLVANLCGTPGTTTGSYVRAFISLISGGASTGARWGCNSTGIGSSGQIFQLPLVAQAVTLGAGATLAVFVVLDAANTTTFGWVPTTPPGTTLATVHPTNFAITRAK